jgi:hypothetical protein
VIGNDLGGLETSLTHLNGFGTSLFTYCPKMVNPEKSGNIK